MNEEIFVVDGRYYLFHNTLLALHGEPVDKRGNPLDGEWIILPKNGFCQLLIGCGESFRRFIERHWLFICVIGAAFGAIGLIYLCPAFIEAVTIGASFRDLLYFGVFTLICLIDLVFCGGSILYEIRSSREEELEE